ncbi:MAG: U32 family peptidase [Alphaproteobacteria bacterium]|nr:U32 family peptidase [Alphaproteobacteria bacterium]
MKTELLAPAGDIEAAYAALYYGADALYLGLKNFSARASATNFDEQQLDEITAYAHYLGRKVYVTINTVLRQDELNEVIKSLDLCVKCKVDAVIVQDLGVAHLIKTQYNELEMHASTQMAVHNKEGALFLKSLGFSRVVLARELTLDEINNISEIDNLETEVFIHGALCYSYSGICQFSALEYSKSANRGRCIYPCRSAFDGAVQGKHIFSMKDLALEQNVLKIKATSLKIEGRKKSALYVAAVTDYYRRILDGQKPDVMRAENIKQIFSRPWCMFHFNGKSKDVTDPNFVGHRGLQIGVINNIAKGRLSFIPTHEFGRFDGLQIDVKGDEKPFGFSVQQIFQNGKNVYQANKGISVEVRLPPKYPKLAKGMTVYLASSSSVKGFYDYKKPKPKEFQNRIPIDVCVDVSQDKLRASSTGVLFETDADLQVAQNANNVYDSFLKSFQKTGDTIFELHHLTLNNPQGFFVPVSLINELRRGLYQNINPVFKHGSLSAVSEKCESTDCGLIIKTDNLDNLQELNLEKFSEIIYLITDKPDFDKLATFDKNKIRLALPTVCRNTEPFRKIISKLQNLGYNKFEAGNYWALNLLDTEKYDVSLSPLIYMMNTEAILMAQEIGIKRISFALEDTKDNMKELVKLSPLKTALIVYQDVPLFTSAVCIRHNDCAHCTGAKKWINLSKDGQIFEALSVNCQTMLFNRKPFSMTQQANDIKASFYELDFCYKPYTSGQVKEITDRILKQIS